MARTVNIVTAGYAWEMGVGQCSLASWSAIGGCHSVSGGAHLCGERQAVQPATLSLHARGVQGLSALRSPPLLAALSRRRRALSRRG